jgi:hypothetical protein
VSYTYTVMAATTSTLSKVTMTVPSGTSGTPTVGTVAPTSIAAGGTVSLSGSTLTYAFTSASVTAGTVLSIQLKGLANTTLAGSQTSTITSYNGATAVDTGTASFSFTNTALTSPGWATTSTVPGASASYTYTFTPSSLLTSLVTGFTMTVPPGTTGTPTIGSVSPAGLLSFLSGVTLSGNRLTVAGSAVTLGLGAAVSIQINGLTNTYTAGSYVSEIVTYTTGLLVDDSAVAPTVTFNAAITISAPAAVSWSGTLQGPNQLLLDLGTGAEQFVVNDQTGSGAGWHVTIAATSFSNGSGYSLPGTGVLAVNGSVTSPTAPAPPTASCLGSAICTLPNDSSVTYPVTITSAPTSPTPETVYDAAPNTGIGPVVIGGTAAADPVGWWLNVPGDAGIGTYNSALTISVISGP